MKRESLRWSLCGGAKRETTRTRENVGENDNVPPSSLHLHRRQSSSFVMMAVLVARLHPGDDVPTRRWAAKPSHGGTIVSKSFRFRVIRAHGTVHRRLLLLFIRDANQKRKKKKKKIERELIDNLDRSAPPWKLNYEARRTFIIYVWSPEPSNLDEIGQVESETEGSTGGGQDRIDRDQCRVK